MKRSKSAIRLSGTLLGRFSILFSLFQKVYVLRQFECVARHKGEVWARSLPEPLTLNVMPVFAFSIENVVRK